VYGKLKEGGVLWVDANLPESFTRKEYATMKECIGKGAGSPTAKDMLSEVLLES
jgi:hypothetical protein